jgi:hypothetical protein
LRDHAELVEFAPELFLHSGWTRWRGLRLQRWMSVARLPGRRLWVHSPNPLDTGLAAALARLGEIAWVVAPSRHHHLALEAWRAAFPRALHAYAPGLVERHPRLCADRVLGVDPEPDWDGALEAAPLAGNPTFVEVLFLHRPSATLLVTDLIENLDRRSLGPVGRLVARAIGGYGRPVAGPAHRLFTLDPAALERSLERVRAWPFTRLVPAHGRPLESDAREAFDGATGELLRAARARGEVARALLRGLARATRS